MDWLSLQQRLPRDPDMTSRTARLLALEAVLEGRLYDVLPYAFSSERTGAGEYVPLDERRPSVRTGLCRVVVEDSVSLLFSEGHFPAVQSEEADVASALTTMIKETRLNETMLEAATRGSIGSVAILFKLVGSAPLFDVLSSAWLTPEWAVEDPRRLCRVTERYKVTGADLVAQGYAVDPDRRYWFTRVWDNRAELWYRPVPVGEAIEPVIDAERSVAHDLGMVPIVWIRNLPGSSASGPDGGCTFAAAIDTVIETDYLLSQAGRGLKYGSDPTLVLKDGGDWAGDAAARRGGAASALVLPPEGDAKLLEINGNAAAAVLAHVRELRAIALESIHGNRAHSDRISAAQSGRALELMCQGLIWLADRLRISYGEGALLSVLRLVCCAPETVPGGVRIGETLHTNLTAKGLSLRWPDWFSPSFADRQAQAGALATLVGSGIMSRTTALTAIAGVYDIENTKGEMKKLEQPVQQPVKSEVKS